MGLNVYAVTKYSVVENSAGDQADDCYSIWQPEGFRDHLGENLKHEMIFDIEETDGDFRIGYGQHSYFRDFLASLCTLAFRLKSLATQILIIVIRITSIDSLTFTVCTRRKTLNLLMISLQ